MDFFANRLARHPRLNIIVDFQEFGSWHTIGSAADFRPEELWSLLVRPPS